MIDHLPCVIGSNANNLGITYDRSYSYHSFLNYARKYPLVFNLFGHIYIVGGRIIPDDNKGLANLVEYHKIPCYSVYGRGKTTKNHFDRMWGGNYSDATSTQFYSHRDNKLNYKEWLPVGNDPTDSACVVGNEIYIFKPSTFSPGKHYFYKHNFMTNSWNRLSLDYTSVNQIEEYKDDYDEDDGFDDDFNISKTFKAISVDDKIFLFFVNLGELSSNKTELLIEILQLL